MTGNDLIAGSLRLLGVLASGETPSASEASDALTSFNDMLDSLSNDNMIIPNKVRDVLALVNGQQTYTLGSGGNWNVGRPMDIENALIQLTDQSPVIELPMTILTKDQYAGILIKTLTSTFPLYLYSDFNYPLSNVSVWPVPQNTYNIVLYNSKPLTTLPTLATTISLPPGYQRMLRYLLAVELAPEYGRAVPETVMAVAMEAKAVIKRQNFVPQYLEVDDSLRATPAVWNWRTGEPT